MARRRINELPEWPNSRDWVGIGCFLLTVALLAMMWADPGLRKDDFFKTIATLIIGTGFINGVVSWAYGSTKQGSELAERNAVVVEQTATNAAGSNEPQSVLVTNDDSEPVPTVSKGNKK